MYRSTRNQHVHQRDSPISWRASECLRLCLQQWSRAWRCLAFDERWFAEVKFTPILNTPHLTSRLQANPGRHTLLLSAGIIRRHHFACTLKFPLIYTHAFSWRNTILIWRFWTLWSLCQPLRILQVVSIWAWSGPRIVSILSRDRMDLNRYRVQCDRVLASCI